MENIGLPKVGSFTLASTVFHGPRKLADYNADGSRVIVDKPKSKTRKVA